MATFPIAHRNSRSTGLVPGRRTQPTTTTPGRVTWITDPSDALTLRGIPAIGRGVAGAIAGTNPAQSHRA
jgi:hypothetical protein